MCTIPSLHEKVKSLAPFIGKIERKGLETSGCKQMGCLHTLQGPCTPISGCQSWAASTEEKSRLKCTWDGPIFFLEVAWEHSPMRGQLHLGLECLAEEWVLAPNYSFLGHFFQTAARALCQHYLATASENLMLYNHQFNKIPHTGCVWLLQQSILARVQDQTRPPTIFQLRRQAWLTLLLGVGNSLQQGFCQHIW